MLLPPKIVFHNVPPDPEVEERIKKEITKLESYYDQIHRCRVVIDIPHRHHGAASPYRIRIELTVPHGEIAVTQEPSLYRTQKKIHVSSHRKQDEAHPMHRSVISTINEVFDTARRRLQDYARKQRGDTKTRIGPSHGRVIRVLSKKGIGYLKSEQGRVIPFRLENVQTSIKSLKAGNKVAFAETVGEKGEEAVAVWSIRKQQHLKAGL